MINKIFSLLRLLQKRHEISYIQKKKKKKKKKAKKSNFIKILFSLIFHIQRIYGVVSGHFKVKITNCKILRGKPIRDALHDLVLFVEFKKHKKCQWRSVTFSNVAG